MDLDDLPSMYCIVNEIEVRTVPTMRINKINLNIK